MKKIGLLLLCLSLGMNAQEILQCRKLGEPAYRFFARQTARPILMAHRVAPAPRAEAENSLSGILHLARTSPCAMPEIDVRSSADGVLGLMHDETLDRTTTGTGKFSSKKWRYLRRLRLKDSKGNILKEGIPSLEQALRAFSSSTIMVLDKKTGTSSSQLMPLLERLRMLDRVLIICYTNQEALEIHHKYPQVMLAVGFANEKEIDEVIASGLPMNRLVALVPNRYISDAHYERIRKLGVPISFSLQGNTDIQMDAVSRYSEIFKKGMRILCTDSISNFKKAF